MTHEEAIEKVGAMKLSPGKDTELIIALHTLIPELRESEDERMMSRIIDGFKNFSRSASKWNNIPVEEVIAYLEKQKEQKPHFDTHWENGSMVCEQKEQKPVHTAKEIWKEMRLEVYAQASGNRHEPNCSDDSTKMFSLCDIDEIFEKIDNSTVEQKPAEWKPQPESLEALMYAVEGKWEMIKPTSYLSRRLEDLYDGLVNTYNVDELPLAELPKTVYTAKDIEEIRALKDKIDASMESSASKPEDRFAEAREKYQVEWSEEDEKNIGSIAARLDSILDCSNATEAIKITKEIAWLKSLRPSWKPSEQKYDGNMDKECIKLCDILNSIPSVDTFESCCGHLKDRYSVWFFCNDIITISRLGRCVERNYSDGKWELLVDSTDTHPTGVFWLRSKEPFQSYDEMEKSVNGLCNCIQHWLNTKFDSYFNGNSCK